MKPRLLLLCPTRTYRAEAFVAAARRLPVDLSIASEEPSALSHLHPESLPAFDFADLEASVSFVREFVRSHPIHAVVAVDDQATLAAAAIGQALGLATNAPDAVYAASNKFRMRERLRAAGVPGPPFRRVPLDADATAVARELEYPVVVKPLMMAASRGVIRADDPASFVAAFSRVARIVTAAGATDEEAGSYLLVEGYVPGWEVAVEGLLLDGRLHALAVFDKPDPLEGPYFPETLYVTPSRLGETERRAVLETTVRTVEALGLRHGPVHVELRGDGARATIIEIAARSIGGLCSRVLRFEGGVALEDLILRHALGLVARVPSPETASSGVMMMQAPASGVFREALGLEAARAVAGVDEVIISAHPGRRVDALPEGFLYLGFIFARGDTPQEVEDALRSSFQRIELVMDDA
jgi:biotin carboxylase